MLRSWYLSHARIRDRRRARDGYDLRPEAIGLSRAHLLVALLGGLR